MEWDEGGAKDELFGDGALVDLIPFRERERLEAECNILGF